MRERRCVRAWAIAVLASGRGLIFVSAATL
jgi:hypothetical protein